MHSCPRLGCTPAPGASQRPGPRSKGSAADFVRGDVEPAAGVESGPGRGTHLSAPSLRRDPPSISRAGGAAARAACSLGRGRGGGGGGGGREGGLGSPRVNGTGTGGGGLLGGPDATAPALAAGPSSGVLLSRQPGPCPSAAASLLCPSVGQVHGQTPPRGGAVGRGHDGGKAGGSLPTGGPEAVPVALATPRLSRAARSPSSRTACASGLAAATTTSVPWRLVWRLVWPGRLRNQRIRKQVTRREALTAAAMRASCRTAMPRNKSG